jgi:beta-glucosidase
MADYLDPALSPRRRTEDLLSRMTVAEKAGMLFHPATELPDARTSREDAVKAATRDVVDRGIAHFNVLNGDTSEDIAAWHNTLQEMAASTRLGIPVTLSSDPRHAFHSLPFTGVAIPTVSRWPETTGLAAVGTREVAHAFGDTMRREFRAMGISVFLGPMADIFSDPRWSRGYGTFGEDADVVARQTAAFVEALRGGAELGPDSVAAVVKHFPGAGPQKEGEDAHDPRHREQVYPGGRQELHLRPFEAAFDAGATQVMTYYGMPVGTDWDEVGFAFNEPVVRGLLRGRYGFDGIVVTDWNLLEAVPMGDIMFGPNGWGLEDRTPAERLRIAFDAGVDQFGGDRCTHLVEELVGDGLITTERLDASVRRILLEKFRLGLFERRRVDPVAARTVCGSPELVACGTRAQRDSLVLLQATESGRPPLARGTRVYGDGIDATAGEAFGLVAARTPEEADVVVVSLDAPYDADDSALGAFHGGSLEFPPEVVATVRDYSRVAPTVVVVYLERPAVLTPLADVASVLVGQFGATDDVLLEALATNTFPGRLPFDLPRSTSAVAAGREDVPFDTANPLFRHGHGLGV